MDTHDASDTFVHLGTGPEASLIPLTPDFWARIGERTELHSGRLVTGGPVDGDWSTWERHPAGDELIVVTDGRIRLHTDDGTTTETTVVEAPRYVLMPAGTWHTVDAMGPARLLIVTWGEGTEHRPR